MPSNIMMQEVWRWKEESARETEGMTSEELIAYYRQAEQRLVEKTGGGKLNLRRLVRSRRKNQAGKA